MVRTVTKKAKDAIVDAAQGVRTMAGEAFGAATKAAADVVFESTANALEAGRVRLRRATPAMENALGNAARRSVSKRNPAGRKATCQDGCCAKARRQTKSGGQEKGGQGKTHCEAAPVSLAQSPNLTAEPARRGTPEPGSYPPLVC